MDIPNVLSSTEAILIDRFLRFSYRQGFQLYNDIDGYYPGFEGSHELINKFLQKEATKQENNNG